MINTKCTLYRLKQDKYGTHGHIEDSESSILCYTIEKPWLNNKENESCIPEGTFACFPHVKSTNMQLCWELKNVPGRTGILIHTGNTEGDSLGCIIVGLRFNAQGVLDSRLALEQLHKKLPSEFSLEIISAIE